MCERVCVTERVERRVRQRKWPLGCGEERCVSVCDRECGIRVPLARCAE